ncbi:MAG: RHS repeat-associated core domain-containing protein, partial [Burkholderiaceae bacterium]
GNYRKGDLKAITNAKGHVTQFTRYNAHGRPTLILDPNGLNIALSYYSRGWLYSLSSAGQTTIFDRYNNGLLKKASSPGGVFLQYTYNDAHQLTDIADELGNTIHYTLDPMGNRTKEDIKDPSKVLRQTHSRKYDTFNRLWKDIGAYDGEETDYTYDPNGNLKTITAPLTDTLSHLTTNDYDAFDRLYQVTDPKLGVTNYKYDPLDQLTKVTDPLKHDTNYTVNGLGNITVTTSPDTGETDKTYYASGEVYSSKDAKGQMTIYDLDELNRVKTITRQDGTAVGLKYDEGVYGKGHLTTLTDPSGSTTFTYDLWGRVLKKTQTVGGQALTVTYGYDGAGRLSNLTLPSQKKIVFTWSAGRITGITVNNLALLSNVTYQPFGGATGWLFANGQTITRRFDLDGRMTSNALASSIIYDKASRIKTINLGNFNILPGYKNYGYDALDRVTYFADPNSSSTIEYDANGNRNKKTTGANITTYNINPANNRLASITGSTSLTYNYDSNGSITSDGVHTFTYDAAGRLLTAGGATYSYNGLGQRVRKTAGGVTTLFAYDESGRLLGEYGPTGTAIQETVYLGDIPVAVLTATGTYYVLADHLNTPRQINNASGQAVWSRDIFVTDGGLPYENPKGLGTFTNNLRFPGQYFDKETNLHYNYYRDYDPSTGRYIESDPIGLAGGLNTYTYANGNPISLKDNLGLAASIVTSSSNTKAEECNKKYPMTKSPKITPPGKYFEMVTPPVTYLEAQQLYAESIDNAREQMDELNESQKQDFIKCLCNKD